MKTTVSIPDEVFEDADRLARDLKTSRSDLYSRALKEFLARHAPDAVTDAMNRVCADVGEAPRTFSRKASRRVLERSLELPPESLSSLASMHRLGRLGEAREVAELILWLSSDRA